MDELEKLRQCAIEGDSAARKLWAMALQYEDSMRRDFGGICYWYQVASEYGLPISGGEPGKLVLVKQAGIQQDIQSGLSLLTLETVAGDDRASANIRISDLHGPGMEINPENAVSMAQKAVTRCILINAAAA